MSRQVRRWASGWGSPPFLCVPHPHTLSPKVSIYRGLVWTLVMRAARGGCRLQPSFQSINRIAGGTGRVCQLFLGCKWLLGMELVGLGVPKRLDRRSYGHFSRKNFFLGCHLF